MNGLNKLDSWYSWQRSGLATKKTTEAQVTGSRPATGEKLCD